MVLSRIFQSWSLSSERFLACQKLQRGVTFRANKADYKLFVILRNTAIKYAGIQKVFIDLI